jgi:hypothetical protein
VVHDDNAPTIGVNRGAGIFAEAGGRDREDAELAAEEIKRIEVIVVIPGRLADIVSAALGANKRRQGRRPVEMEDLESAAHYGEQVGGPGHTGEHRGRLFEGSSVQHLAQVLAQLTVQHFASAFRDKHYVVLALPSGVA